MNALNARKALVPKQVGTYQWDASKTCTLLKAMQTHGHDVQSIHKHFLPTVLPSLITAKIDRFKPTISGKWTIKDDIAFIDHLLVHGRSKFNPLAGVLGRKLQDVRNRHYLIIKPQSLLIASKYPTLTLGQVWRLQRKQLQDLAAINGIESLSTDHSLGMRGSTLLGEWAEKEDAVIFDLVRKMGHKWALIASDMPGRSPAEIYRRYQKLLKRAEVPWTLEEIKLLRTLLEKYTNVAKLHTIQVNHFPTRSIPSLRKQLEITNKNESPIPLELVDFISKRVKQHSRDYFLVHAPKEIPDRSPKQLLEFWAKHEPKDQEKAIWTRERDERLVAAYAKNSRLSTVRKGFPLFYCTELRSRLEHLGHGI